MYQKIFSEKKKINIPVKLLDPSLRIQKQREKSTETENLLENDLPTLRVRPRLLRAFSFNLDSHVFPRQDVVFQCLYSVVPRVAPKTSRSYDTRTSMPLRPASKTTNTLSERKRHSPRRVAGKRGPCGELGFSGKRIRARRKPSPLPLRETAIKHPQRVGRGRLDESYVHAVHDTCACNVCRTTCREKSRGDGHVSNGAANAMAYKT